MLGDPTERLTRLQGWRGENAGRADRAVGALAPNHPFESLYNRRAARRGRTTLPPNRAAKRLGCAIGVVFLGGAAVAYSAGAATLGLVLALVLAATAAFVAITGICIPAMIFTIVWGSERACAPSLYRSADRTAVP